MNSLSIIVVGGYVYLFTWQFQSDMVENIDCLTGTSYSYVPG